MKVKLNTNGQIIDPPLRLAQRLIRFGRASAYIAPKKEEIIETIKQIRTTDEVKEAIIKEIKSDKVFDNEFNGLDKEEKTEPIEAEIMYDGIDKITEIKKDKKDKKSKK